MRESRRKIPVAAVLVLLAACVCWSLFPVTGELPLAGADAPQSTDDPSTKDPDDGKSGDAGVAQDRHSIFTDVTAALGIDFVHNNGATGRYRNIECMTSGGAFLDYDGDGDLDVYLTQANDYDEPDPKRVSRLYRNDGDRFTDVTEASGAGVSAYAMGCFAADYDNDGDVDMYITVVGRDLLLRNNGDGTFEEVGLAAGLVVPARTSQFSSSACWFDYDRDGYLDLYVARYCRGYEVANKVCKSHNSTEVDYCGPKAYDTVGDRLYRNKRDGTFEDVTRKAGLSRTTGYSFAMAASDYNRDGWLDLYVACDQSPALLWINQKNGTFKEKGMARGAALDGAGRPIAGMGVVAEDFDEDGDFDLFITNLAKENNLFLSNNGKGYFQDFTHAWGKRDWTYPWTGFGALAFDQNHDTRLDLFVANGAVMLPSRPPVPEHPYDEPNSFLRQDTTGRFVDASRELDGQLVLPARSRGLAMGDYDNDGDLDLLVCRTNAAPQLLRNNHNAGGSGSGHWLQIRTRHEDGRWDVLNAVVELRCGERRFLREVRPHHSYLTTCDPRVHFGLGTIAKVDRLRVAWPDTTVEEFPVPGVDREITVRKGQGKAVE